MKPRTVFCVLAIVAVGWSAASYSRAESPAAPAAAGGDLDAFNKELAGKVIVVYREAARDGRGSNTLTVENPKIRDILGRRFLVGAYPEVNRKGQESLKGVPTHLLWDSVTEFMLMTPAQYKNWLEEFNKE